MAKVESKKQAKGSEQGAGKGSREQDSARVLARTKSRKKCQGRVLARTESRKQGKAVG